MDTIYAALQTWGPLELLTITASHSPTHSYTDGGVNMQGNSQLIIRDPWLAQEHLDIKLGGVEEPATSGGRSKPIVYLSKSTVTLHWILLK